MFETNEKPHEIFNFSYKELIKSDLSCTASHNLKLFEDSIKETIRRFEKKHNAYCEKSHKISIKISKLDEKQSNYIENIDLEYQELQNQKYQLYEEQHDYELERYWINQQLKSLSEMQIINAFKNVEINIKTLVNIAYPTVDTKEFYKWESFLQFFKNRDIKVFQIKGYKEIVDLKNLNNAIKHNGVLNEEIKKIEEFKTFEEFDFVNLINFYERIKDVIQSFLLSLADEIRKDLFEFSDDRITQISQDFKQRMGKAEIKSLVKKLTEK
ncbi:MAG: hypothetical protein B7Y83_08475 [Flavobacteriales bacterium 32-34-25]|nr:MAG: hypothetical protein B7Y83_08475 [Flavobacteriales bacterium 32-34-25]